MIVKVRSCSSEVTGNLDAETLLASWISGGRSYRGRGYRPKHKMEMLKLLMS